MPERNARRRYDWVPFAIGGMSGFIAYQIDGAIGALLMALGVFAGGLARASRSSSPAKTGQGDRRRRAALDDLGRDERRRWAIRQVSLIWQGRNTPWGRRAIRSWIDYGQGRRELGY